MVASGKEQAVHHSLNANRVLQISLHRRKRVDHPGGVAGGVKMQEKGDLKMQGTFRVPPAQCGCILMPAAR
jgi:hypothetical protein